MNLIVKSLTLRLKDKDKQMYYCLQKWSFEFISLKVWFNQNILSDMTTFQSVLRYLSRIKFINYSLTLFLIF